MTAYFREQPSSEFPASERGRVLASLASARSLVEFSFFRTLVYTEQFPFIPKVVYLAVKIANASKLEKSSPEEILENISFSDFIFNSHVRDFNMRYFHSFVQASEDFLVLPVTSLEIQPDAILKSCQNGNPPIEMMIFNENAKGLVRIFDKKTMKWLPKEFVSSEETFQMHPIQGFYDSQSQEIVLDTLEIMNHNMIQEKVHSSMISKFLETRLTPRFKWPISWSLHILIKTVERSEALRQNISYFNFWREASLRSVIFSENKQTN